MGVESDGVLDLSHARRRRAPPRNGFCMLLDERYYSVRLSVSGAFGRIFSDACNDRGSTFWLRNFRSDGFP